MNEQEKIGGEAQELPKETQEIAAPAEKEQSRAERAAQAAARRRRETEAAIEKATAPLLAELNERNVREEQLRAELLRLRESCERMGGRAHLTATRQRGEGRKSVPPESMQLYRALNPELREEELRAHYDRFLSET